MRFTTLVLAVAMLSACATEPARTSSASSDGRDCFRAASATGFGIIDEHHVRVSVGANRDYSLTTRMDANRLDWTRAIAIDGPSYICTGNGLGVSLVGGEPVQHFVVSEIVRLPSDTPRGS